MSIVNKFMKSGFKSKVIESNVYSFTQIKKVIAGAAIAVSCALNPAFAQDNGGNFSFRITLKDGKFQMTQGTPATNRDLESLRPKLRPDDLLVGYQIPDAFTLIQINSQINSNAGITKVGFSTREQCMDILVSAVQPWYSEGQRINSADVNSDLNLGQRELQRQFVNIIQNNNKLEEDSLYFIDENATNRIGCFKM